MTSSSCSWARRKRRPFSRNRRTYSPIFAPIATIFARLPLRVRGCPTTRPAVSPYCADMHCVRIVALLLGGQAFAASVEEYVDNGTDAIANQCAELKCQHARVVTDQKSFLQYSIRVTHSHAVADPPTVQVDHRPCPHTLGPVAYIIHRLSLWSKWCHSHAASDC